MICTYVYMCMIFLMNFIYILHIYIHIFINTYVFTLCVMVKWTIAHQAPLSMGFSRPK